MISDIQLYDSNLVKRIDTNLAGKKSQLILKVRATEKRLMKYPDIFPWELRVIREHIKPSILKIGILSRGYKSFLVQFEKSFDLHEATIEANKKRALVERLMK